MSSNTEVQTTSKVAVAVRSAANLSADNWSDERIGAIRSTCCPPNATNAQLAIFLATCQRYDLDPICKEIWLVEDRGRIMVVTGRDAYVKIASREKIYRGFQSGVVHQNDEFSLTVNGRDVVVTHKIKGFDRGAIVGAYCVLFVEGRPPQVITRTWAQYKHLQTKDTWVKYGSDLLETRCIVAALKRQFSLAGIEEEDVARDVLAGRDPGIGEVSNAAAIAGTANTAEAVRERLRALGSGQPAGVDADGVVEEDDGAEGHARAMSDDETEAMEARIREENLQLDQELAAGRED